MRGDQSDRRRVWVAVLLLWVFWCASAMAQTAPASSAEDGSARLKAIRGARPDLTDEADPQKRITSYIAVFDEMAKIIDRRSYKDPYDMTNAVLSVLHRIHEPQTLRGTTPEQRRTLELAMWKFMDEQFPRMLEPRGDKPDPRLKAVQTHWRQVMAHSFEAVALRPRIDFERLRKVVSTYPEGVDLECLDDFNGSVLDDRVPAWVESMDFTAQQWDAYLQSFADSKNLMAQFYARFGRLSLRIVQSPEHRLDAAALTQLLAELDALTLDYRRIPIPQRAPDGKGFYRAGSSTDLDVMDHLRRDLKTALDDAKALPDLGPVASIVIQKGAERDPDPSPRGPTSASAPDRIRVNPIPLMVKARDGTVAAFVNRYSGKSAGATPEARIVYRFGSGFDVHVWSGGVLFMQKEGLLEEVLVDPDAGFRRAAWDGKNVWITTRDSGVWIIHPDRSVTKIGKEQGLPPGDASLEIACILAGRAIAAGSGGPGPGEGASAQPTGWCAMLRDPALGATGDVVTVIHKASVRPATGAAVDPVDRKLSFDCDYIVPYLAAGRIHGLFWLIGRGPRLQPLVVDIRTKLVVISPLKIGGQPHYWNSIQWMPDGTLIETPDGGPLLLHSFDDTKHVITTQKLPSTETIGQVVGQGPWYYVPGKTAWWRVGLKHEIESVPIEPDAIPAAEAGRQTIYESAHYGMVVWSGKGLFQIVVRDATNTTTPPVTPPSAPAGLRIPGSLHNNDSVRPAH